MGAPDTDIRAAFVTKLQEYAGLPPVAWENVPYTPTIGTLYIRPSIVQADVSQVELGTIGINRHIGFMQISIFAPAGVGTATAYALRDGLINHFKRGTVLTYNSVRTMVTQAYPNPSLQETDWLHLPITINYRTESAN